MKFSKSRVALLRKRYVSTANTVFQIGLHSFIIYLVLASGRKVFWGYPLLAEGIIQVVSSEFNRWKLHCRRRETRERIKGNPEYGPTNKPECIATVVGYREDSEIFTECVKSYQANFDKRHNAVCIGIDGNDPEDLKMRTVAENVFGSRLLNIDLGDSFGALARKKLEAIAKDDGSVLSDGCKDKIMESLISKATRILKKRGALRCSSDDPQPICIVQPHYNKKEIMFTTFVFALALARANGVEFIWSSDSDSWVFPGTIETAIDCMKPDERLAGSCTSLTIHNGHLSALGTMVAAAYQTDLALTSSLLSSCEAADCQSGPCAAFRSAALRSILLSWFDQKVLGQRPVVNEDRHLTTCLLMAGYKVTYNPLAVVATDTPTSLPKWIAQQTRWARATAIESLCYPRMYIMRHPILGLFAFRRLVIPVVNFFVVARYITTGVGGHYSSILDVGLRLLVVALHATFNNWQGCTGFLTHCASVLVMQVPQAAFLFWATATMFDSHWGTPMRSQNEQGKSTKAKFLNQHFGNLVTTTIWMSMVSASFLRYIATTWAIMTPIYAAVGGFVGTAALFSFAIASGA